jgi:hypothetical protein
VTRRAHSTTTISFTAERVATHVEDFTDTFRVHGVYFEAGDPEAGGESWNFTRSSEDDDGVCTVREVQRATLYDGIQELELSRSRLVCNFEPAAHKEAGCARLEIQLKLDDATWEKVAQMMDTVCSGKEFYRRG